MQRRRDPGAEVDDDDDDEEELGKSSGSRSCSRNLAPGLQLASLTPPLSPTSRTEKGASWSSWLAFAFASASAQ